MKTIVSELRNGSIITEKCKQKGIWGWQVNEKGNLTSELLSKKNVLLFHIKTCTSKRDASYRSLWLRQFSNQICKAKSKKNLIKHSSKHVFKKLDRGISNQEHKILKIYSLSLYVYICKAVYVCIQLSKSLLLDMRFDAHCKLG